MERLLRYKYAKNARIYESLNGDLSNWDVSSVTRMSSMFQGGSFKFNAAISDWDVSSVQYMDSMFQDNDDFQQNLCSWAERVDNALQTENMFLGTSCPANDNPTFRMAPGASSVYRGSSSLYKLSR